jgi:hypothetical protein
MYNAGKKIDELTCVLVMAKAADANGQREKLVRMVEELQTQSVILLREIRQPMQTSATVYDLAKERGARARAHA